MDIERRLEVVEQENEMLREQVHRLENALSATSSPLPFEWALTAQETIVFGVLANRPLATKDAVMAALYRSMGKEEAGPKIVDVFICKMRKKLTPYGIMINTVWGQGYALADTDRAKFRRAA